MFEIWATEADGKRVLVRDDVAEGNLARALVNGMARGCLSTRSCAAT